MLDSAARRADAGFRGSPPAGAQAGSVVRSHPQNAGSQGSVRSTPRGSVPTDDRRVELYRKRSRGHELANVAPIRNHGGVRVGAPTEPGGKDRSIVIVGGGIAGLYAAYLLGLLKYDVQLFEMDNRWGGRIDSRVFKLDGADSFIAEFGPMRFEARLQERLRRLCFHLGIDFEPFSPTSAPISTTHYDLTATEESIKSPADLLQWAVLKMFFEDRVKRELDDIEIKEEQRGGKRAGPRQLAVLKAHMDSRYFCRVSEARGKLRVVARDDREIQAKLNALRLTATLRGRRGAAHLSELGLWNALSEVISPGAVARIRDSGTFYHFIAQNPGALEWGIFWLRQASVMGDLFRFRHEDAPNGTYSLVGKLVDKIEHDCPTVTLNRSHQVVRVAPMTRSRRLQLTVERRNRGNRPSIPLTVPADEVIFALPRQPLVKLAEHFPADVLSVVEGVVAMPLLKAFLVTREPWWRHHLEAQAFAWLVPTRELHFFRPSDPGCDGIKGGPDDCDCDKNSRVANDIGMIMLYTDQPAIRYWQAVMTPGQHGRTRWTPYKDGSGAVQEVKAHPDGVLANLIRRLMVIPDPGLARSINLNQAKIARRLKASNPPLAKRIEEAPSGRLKFAEQVYRATKGDRVGQAVVEQELRNAKIDVGESSEWHRWLEFAIKYATFKLNVRERTEKLAQHVRAYGIRDWSDEPFGGASHVWLPAKSGGLRHKPEKLIAFSLRGRAGAKDTNVHICGEAYSDFQGFIEGALRTAEEVVDRIAGGGQAGAAFSLGKDIEAREKEAAWMDKQPTELTDRWNTSP
jgi:monoamine oxidase